VHASPGDPEGTFTMHSLKRRVAVVFGAAIATATASALAATPASAHGFPPLPTGISVAADPTAPTTVLVASLEGRNEGDAGAPAGQALALIGLHDDSVSYSITWRGVDPPTALAIRAGARGVDGPIVVPLFTTPSHPARGAAAGTVTVADASILAALRSDPGSFYVDLRSRLFPNGAARAQLHLVTHGVTTTGVAARQESVLLGSQVYACTVQPDGSFAFTQHDVDAHLSDGIRHTFVQPDAGPPQWRAPDGTAVSGTVVTRNPNGDGNIAELNLDATQIGTSNGLLGHAVEVLRLNTVGGVAPTGACDPHATPTVNVRYQADYVFVNG
jgi:hypothetical protein